MLNTTEANNPTTQRPHPTLPNRTTQTNPLTPEDVKDQQNSYQLKRRWLSLMCRFRPKHTPTGRSHGRHPAKILRKKSKPSLMKSWGASAKKMNVFGWYRSN
jgi:hypothetical protein